MATACDGNNGVGGGSGHVGTRASPSGARQRTARLPSTAKRDRARAAVRSRRRGSAREAAARLPVRDARHRAFDALLARAVAPVRHAGEQRRGIGVRRPLDHLARRPALHQHAAVEHRDLVGVLVDERQVVRDEQHREPIVAREGGDDVEHLRLDGHVQRRRRLVGDQQPRLVDQRCRDHHALAHAARQLVRELSQDLLGIAEAHLAQQLERPARGWSGTLRLPCASIASTSWRSTVISGLRLDIGSWKIMAISEPRSGRSTRLRRGQDRVRRTGSTPSMSSSGVGQQPHDRARDHGLARAAFADQGEELPRRDAEARHPRRS